MVASGEGGKGESTIETFTTVADDLAVTTGEAEVTKVSATLKGTVTPGTGPVTKCEFEYGTTKGSLTSGPLPCAGSLPGAGATPVPVSAEAKGLTPNTKYYFQLVAENEAGVPAEGAEASFKTIADAPLATSGKAPEVKLTSAVLVGSVNAGGAPLTSCEFEYGPTPSPEKSISCSPGAGEEVTATVEHLTPNTPYYFRVVAR